MNAPQLCASCGRPKATNKFPRCKPCALAAGWAGIAKPKHPRCIGCNRKKAATVNEKCHACANADTRARKGGRIIPLYDACIDCGKPRRMPSASPRCCEHAQAELRRLRAALRPAAAPESAPPATAPNAPENFARLLARAQAIRQQKECRP